MYFAKVQGIKQKWEKERDSDIKSHIYHLWQFSFLPVDSDYHLVSIPFCPKDFLYHLVRQVLESSLLLALLSTDLYFNLGLYLFSLCLRDSFDYCRILLLAGLVFLTSAF